MEIIDEVAARIAVLEAEARIAAGFRATVELPGYKIIDYRVPSLGETVLTDDLLTIYTCLSASNEGFFILEKEDS